jgi:hypothetical protein
MGLQARHERVRPQLTLIRRTTIAGRNVLASGTLVLGPGQDEAELDVEGLMLKIAFVEVDDVDSGIDLRHRDRAKLVHAGELSTTIEIPKTKSIPFFYSIKAFAETDAGESIDFQLFVDGLKTKRTVRVLTYAIVENANG